MEHKRGGKRIGAGRKKGFKAIEAEKAREYIVNRVAQELEPIITAQIALAVGIKMNTEDGDVYIKEPSIVAGKYLLDQCIGKPKESVAITQNDGLTLKELYERALETDY